MAEKPHGQTWTWAILLGALVIGTWLRWIYVEGTPATLRAHDFQGHMDYLGFVLEHGRIPTATQGFQGYQPPLYYFIAAPIAAQVETGGRPDLGVLQQLALWTGVLSLGWGPCAESQLTVV